MTFRRFFYRSLAVSAAVVLVFVAFNVFMNEFGLFGNARGKQIRIWTAEKTSKYLLTFNYIPANYNALVIGPSFSDFLDTTKLHDYKFYNLSIQGGNVREFKLSLFNVLERGHIDLMIICIHPFITSNDVLTDKRLTPQVYWSTLGSTFTSKFYNDKIKMLLNPGKDMFSGSVNGSLRPVQMVASVDAAIDAFAAKTRRLSPIDASAFAGFREIIDQAHQKGVRIVAYYHPDPFKVFTAYERNYRSYQKTIDDLFSPEDLVHDFNAPAYNAFRKDSTNYIDHGHLSAKGADFVVGELNRLINTTPSFIQAQE